MDQDNQQVQSAEGAGSPAEAPPQQQRREVPILGQTMGRGIDMRSLEQPGEVDPELVQGPVDNPNVELQFDYNYKEFPPVPLRDRKDLTGNVEMISFLAERGEAVDDRIRAFVQPGALQRGPGAIWNQSIVAAATHSAYLDGRFDASVRSENSKWLQYLQTESGKLGFTAPKVAEAGVGSYSGPAGIQRVRAIMGLGGLISIPLWHSGFWITLQAPPESAYIELQRRLQEEKIELGRETFGLVFSNEQSYINSWLLDFCFEYLYDTSVRVDNNQDLRPLIKIQDLNILFWGMARLIWPRGFDYIRSLTTKEGIEQSQTVSAKIDLAKLMFIDNASFSDKQKTHMTTRQRGKMTVEQVKDYQATYIPTLAAGRRVTIREGLDVLIASTDVENYIADGENWIAGIVSTVDSTFTQAVPTQDERNRMISTHARATRLRNNGAWIKSFFVDDIEVTERDDITAYLDILSIDDEATELIEKEVNRFKDDSTRALIAIPETSGKEVGLPRFPHLIPIDVVNTFFTLLAQRVAIISRR